MILLQLVVLTIVASCQAKHEHLGEPVPQRIKPHGQTPAQPHPIPEYAKPSGPSQDDSPDPLLQRSSTLNRNQPDSSGHERTTGQRDDTSKGSELEIKLMKEQVRAHDRKKIRQDTKSHKSILKTRGSHNQKPSSPNRNYPDRNGSKRSRHSDQPKGFVPEKLLLSRKMRADRRSKRDLLKANKSTSNTVRRSPKQRLRSPSRNHPVAKRRSENPDKLLVLGPDPPAALYNSHTGNATILSINWNKQLTGEHNINYEIAYRSAMDANTTKPTIVHTPCISNDNSHDEITKCRYKIGGLKRNHPYHFNVTAISDTGRSSASLDAHTPSHDCCTYKWDCAYKGIHGRCYSHHGFQCLVNTSFCCPVPPTTRPGPVHEFSLTLQDPTTFAVKWKGNHTTNYTIWYTDITISRASNNNTHRSKSLTDKNTYEYNITGLQPARTYNLSIFAVNAIGNFTEHRGEFYSASLNYTNTKALLTALLKGQGSTVTSEGDKKRAYDKGVKVVTDNGGIGMVKIRGKIIDYVDRIPGQSDISTIATNICTGVGAYLNQKVVAVDKVKELKGNDEITNAIVEVLTYGHNKTMSPFTSVNEKDAKKYTNKLFELLEDPGAFGNPGVFRVMKMIADQSETMKVVAAMLHNENGYNVDDLARETAKSLVNKKVTDKPSELEKLFNEVGNQLVTMPSDEVSTAVRKAETALEKKMDETKISHPMKFGSSIKGEKDNEGTVIGAQIFQALRGSLSNLSTDNFVDGQTFDLTAIKKVFKAFILAGSGKSETKLNKFVEGLVNSIAASTNKSELRLIQTFVKNSGLTASAAGKTAARNDYLGNNGKNVLALFNAITEVINSQPGDAETEVTDEDILNDNLKTGKVTPQMVAQKIGNDSEITNGIKQILGGAGFDGNTTTSPIDRATARGCIEVLFGGFKERFPDKANDKVWDSVRLIANGSLDIVEYVARMLRQQVSCDQIAKNVNPIASKRFLNKMRKKMLKSFPAADPSNIAELKQKFEKMFAELKKYADKQTSDNKNYTTFGETFGKDQGKQANTALQSIVDSMKLTLKTRRKRAPSPAAINAMSGFVNTILGLIGLNTGANPANLRSLLNGIAHGTTQPGAGALDAEAGPATGATTKGGNGATKDVGINSGQNSGAMADALQEGLSNMNAGDNADDDDEGDSLWWIGLIIGILLLIIIIIVVILLLRRRKKEEPVEPEIDVIAVAADTVSETMTTYGAEMLGVVMTSVVTTTTTHYQPGDPQTEPTQLSEEVITGVGGEQVININVIHVNQDKEESSTDDVDSDADAHTDGHILTDTEQSEVLCNADGTKQQPKEKKEKRRIKKSEKKKKMEEKQKKLDENKDQVEQKKADDEINKDTQPQIIIINEGQPNSGEKEIKNENENEVKEKEKSAKNDETGQIIIIHHQYDGPKSKEDDQLEKPKSQQEKDEIQKNENKVTSKKESITKLTTNQQEGQPKIGDEENKVTRKESATKSAANPETSSKQKAEDDEKDTKNRSEPEGNQLRTANDDDKQAKRRESTTQSAAKPTENDKKSKRDGSRTQVSQKPESKSQIGSVKKTNQNNELTTKSKAKTDEQKSVKLKSEKSRSKFDSTDVKANENKSQTQEIQRQFQQSDTKQTAEELDQINKSTHQQTAYEKEKALYADPNYETVVHQAQQPTAQLHVGQAKDEGKENVVTKKVITVTTITTTNQEEGKK